MNRVCLCVCIWVYRPIYTECPKHKKPLPNFELQTLLPSELPQFVRFRLQCVESVPQGCWHMLTPKLPTVVSSWLDVLWETVERGNPSSVAVLDTLNPVHLAPTAIPHSKALKSFVLPIHPLNGTHTQSMSQLSQGLKILLYPVSSPSSTLNWSGFNKWHQ